MTDPYESQSRVVCLIAHLEASRGDTTPLFVRTEGFKAASRIVANRLQRARAVSLAAGPCLVCHIIFASGIPASVRETWIVEVVTILLQPADDFNSTTVLNVTKSRGAAEGPEPRVWAPQLVPSANTPPSSTERE